MDEILIANWNATVKPSDIIWHLGDFALCGSLRIRELASILNGRKCLIIGNHDRRRTKGFWLRAGFDEVHETPYKYGEYILSHEPVPDTPLINICGHVHSQTHKLNKHNWCVSVEVTGYKPITLDALSHRTD